MKKTTFYGLAVFSGVCAVISALELRREFFPAAKVSRVEQDFIAKGNALRAYKIGKGPKPVAEPEAELKMVPRPSY